MGVITEDGYDHMVSEFHEVPLKKGETVTYFTAVTNRTKETQSYTVTLEDHYNGKFDKISTDFNGTTTFTLNPGEERTLEEVVHLKDDTTEGDVFPVKITVVANDNPRDKATAEGTIKTYVNSINPQLSVGSNLARLSKEMQDEITNAVIYNVHTENPLEQTVTDFFIKDYHIGGKIATKCGVTPIKYKNLTFTPTTEIQEQEFSYDNVTFKPQFTVEVTDFSKSVRRDIKVNHFEK